MRGIICKTKIVKLCCNHYEYCRDSIHTTHLIQELNGALAAILFNYFDPKKEKQMEMVSIFPLKVYQVLFQKLLRLLIIGIIWRIGHLMIFYWK